MKEKLEKVKNHLKSWGHSKLFAEANTAEIESLEKLIKELKYHDPKENGCFKNSFIRLRQTQREIADETKQIEAADEQTANMIKNLGDKRLSTLLELRYRQQMPWAEIAERTSYSESKVFAMHQKALLLVYQQLNSYQIVAK
ncbi:MAG: hypothetical protein QM308_00570 [Bacillota bacterium]|nr:hypothetical protein [Bacillota bacterium]